MKLYDNIMAKKETNMYMYAMQYGGAVGFSGVQYRPNKNPLTDPFPALKMTDGASKKKEGNSNYKNSDRETLKRIDGTTGLSKLYNKQIATMEQELNTQFNSVLHEEFDFLTYANNVAKAKSEVAIMHTKANNIQKEYDEMKDDDRNKGTAFFMTNNKQFIVKDYKKGDDGNYITDESGNKIYEGYKYINAVDLNSVEDRDVLTFNQATELLNHSDNENLLNAITGNRQAVSSDKDYNEYLDNRTKSLGRITKLEGMTPDNGGHKALRLHSILFKNKNGNDVNVDLESFKSLINNNYILSDKTSAIDNANSFISTYRDNLGSDNLNNLYLKAVTNLINNGSFDISDIAKRTKDLEGKNIDYYYKLIQDLANVGNYVIGKKDMDLIINNLANQENVIAAYGGGSDKSEDAQKTNTKNRLNEMLGNHISENEKQNIDLIKGEELSGDKLNLVKQNLIKLQENRILAKDIFERLGIDVNIKFGKNGVDDGGSGKNPNVSYFSDLVFRDDMQPLTNYMSEEKYKTKQGLHLNHRIADIYAEKIKGGKDDDKGIVIDESARSKEYSTGNYKTLNNHRVNPKTTVTDGIYYITALPVKKNNEIAYNDVSARLANLVKSKLIENADITLRNYKGFKDLTEEDISKYTNLIAEYYAVQYLGYKGSTFKRDKEGLIVAISKDNDDELGKVRELIGNTKINNFTGTLKSDVYDYLTSLNANGDGKAGGLIKSLQIDGGIDLKRLGNFMSNNVNYGVKVATTGYNIIDSDFLEEMGKEKLQSPKVWKSKFPAINDKTIEEFKALDNDKQSFLINQAVNFYNNLEANQLDALEACFKGKDDNICKRTAEGFVSYIKEFKGKNITDDFKDAIKYKSIEKKYSDDMSFLTKILNKQMVYSNVDTNADAYAQWLRKGAYTTNDIRERNEMVKGSVGDIKTNEIHTLLNL